MELHRTGKIAQWKTVSPDKQNSWQRLAARTDGVLTPGNVTSSIGLALVLAGLAAVIFHAYWLGISLVAIGRLADILDGILAERTATKSPLGETVDASFDKVGALATLLVLAVEGLLPWAIAVIIGVQSTANIVLALYAHGKGSTLHPSKIGKLSAVGVWLCILIFALAKPLSDNDWRGADYMLTFCYVFAVIAIAFSLLATFGYTRAAMTIWRQGTKDGL